MNAVLKWRVHPSLEGAEFSARWSIEDLVEGHLLGGRHQALFTGLRREDVPDPPEEGIESQLPWGQLGVSLGGGGSRWCSAGRGGVLELLEWDKRRK